MSNNSPCCQIQSSFFPSLHSEATQSFQEEHSFLIRPLAFAVTTGFLCMRMLVFSTLSRQSKAIQGILFLVTASAVPAWHDRRRRRLHQRQLRFRGFITRHDDDLVASRSNACRCFLSFCSAVYFSQLSNHSLPS